MNFLFIQYLLKLKLHAQLKYISALSSYITVFTISMGINPLLADKVLSDMNFNQGQWVMIGIPIHNAQMLPVQEELGTFTIDERQVLLNTHQQWDLPLTFENKCDYHYELKFYKDGKLKRTFKINLFCGKLFDEGISYQFDPKLFEDIRRVAKPVDWSRITFNNLDILRKAISLLDQSPEVYWYKDVQPYYYSGYFLLRVVGIPWDANMDTVNNRIRNMISSKVNSNDFYLKEYLTSMSGEKKIVKYAVYCNENISDRYGPGKYIKWRSHFYGKDSLQVVAIGIDLKRYQELMGMGGTRTRDE